MANSANLIPQRFYSLDTARGICSLSVVFWHWRYLFFDGTTPASINVSAQPFYPIFFAFYEKGYLAVDFFFCLSGFLFFWLYGERIRRQELKAKAFFWLRFSRLYPLHLCMLLVIVFSQQWMLNKTGSFFVYPADDLYRFALSLLLVMDWGVQPELSFNAPAWSISIEVLLYTLFFLICRKNVFRWCWLIAGLLIVVEMSGHSIDISRGGLAFLAGGLVYHVYAAMAANGACERWSRVLLSASLLCLGFWLAGLYLKLDVVGPILASFTEHAASLSDQAYNPVFLDRCKALLTTAVLFPFVILTLVVLETTRGALAKRFAYLGDLSFSIYLIHFPLQLFFAYGAASLGLDKSFFYTGQSLVMFMALLMLLSTASFHLFENPARRFLRDFKLAALIPGARAIKPRLAD